MKTLLLSLITFALGWLVGSGGREPGWFTGEKAANRPAAVTQAAQLKTNSAAAFPNTRDDKPRAESDPFARWEAALKAGKLTDPKLRRDLMRQMAALDPQRAWELLMSGAVPVQLADIEDFALAFSEKDGLAAAQFGLGIADEYPRSMFLRRALTAWLLEKPGDCLAWLQGQREQLDLPGYLRITGWGSNFDHFTLPDLESLMAIHPASDRFPDLAGDIFQKANQNSASAAETLAWLHRQPASDVRDGLWRGYIEQLADKGDLQAAASFVNEIADPNRRRRATSEIAARLAGDDPRAGLAYAASLTEPDASRAAWQSAFISWVAQKPDEALAYANENIQNLTPQLLNAAVGQWTGRRPAETLALALRFPQSAERADFISEVLDTWSYVAAPQALAWLNSPQVYASLPAADLAKLRGNLERTLNPQNTGTVTSSNTVNDRRVSYTY